MKTEHMTQDVIEISCENPQDALDIVEKIPGVDEAALFGKGLHAVVSDAESAITAVQSRLSAESFGQVQARKITPSLEDVFVSLIERHDQSSQAQGEVAR